MRARFKMIVCQNEELIYFIATNDKALIRRKFLQYSHTTCLTQLWVDSKPLGEMQALTFCKRRPKGKNKRLLRQWGG